MTSAVHLPVWPVEQLDGPDARFRCVPLKSVIAAGTCVRRQDAQRAGGRNQHGESFARAFAPCAACALGAQVRARVGEPPADWRPSAPPAPSPPPAPDPERVAQIRAADARRLNNLFTVVTTPSSKEEPVLRESKAEAKNTETNGPVEHGAACARPGCTRPRAQVRANTRPEERTWCRQCRNAAQKKRTPSALHKTAATASARKSVARRKPARAAAPVAVVDQVTEAFRALGLVQCIGWDLAEQLAAKIGGAS